jgi:hypothetical protein
MIKKQHDKTVAEFLQMEVAKAIGTHCKESVSRL